MLIGEQKAIEILVNSAGITHYSPLFVTSVGSLEKIIETNLMGTMLACKVVGKGMIGNKAHRGGRSSFSYSFWKVQSSMYRWLTAPLQAVSSILLHY